MGNRANISHTEITKYFPVKDFRRIPQEWVMFIMGH